MTRFLIFILTFILSFSAFSKTLIAVTENWPPFEYRETVDGTHTELGTDVEIVRKILKKLGYEVRIMWLPWSRCLKAVMSGWADMIFSASKTPERERYLFYPEEPLGYTTNVFFYRKGENIKFEKPEDLKGLRVAYIESYYYGEIFKTLPLIFLPVERTEIGFKLLLKKRVDLVIEDVNVGLSVARKLHILDKIDYIKKPVWGPDPQYAAFVKKPGYDKLAKKFSEELKKLKRSKEYFDILKKYGVIYF